MRPRPSNYVAWGSTASLKTAYTKAKTMQMLKRDTRWTLVFEDLKSAEFSMSELEDQTNFVEMKPTDVNCCIIRNMKGQSESWTFLKIQKSSMMRI